MNTKPSTREVLPGAIAAVVLGLVFIAVGLADLGQLHLFGMVTAVAAAFGSTAKGHQ